MRNAFADEITKIAQGDERFVLLSGDIGNRLFNNYKDSFGNRFFNCGVAEANMISMAAGMALSGLKPVAYTITPFITTRCYEQIHVDICYHDLPVVIVGVGAGFSYAGNGPTHHSCEDIAILRVLPGMNVICPGDSWEVRAAIKAALKCSHPVYIRLGKKGEPVVHSNVPDFTIGKSITVKEGKDVCFLSTGNLLPNVLKAAELLQEDNITARVESFHTVKPLDTETLEEVFVNYKLVLTVEEHSILGGLGGAVAEWLTNAGNGKGRLFRVGSGDCFFHEAGPQEYVREMLGLTGDGIRTTSLLCLDAVENNLPFEIK